MFAKDAEREIALRGEARYVRRLDRGRPTREQWLDPALPLRLESRERGHLDTLHFAPFELPQCGPGQVLIEVKAAGMNFRDVLKALALYPGDAPDARIFGDEVGGIVRAVGAECNPRCSGRSRFWSRRFRTCHAHPGARRRRAAHSGGSDFRSGGDAAGRIHDCVACAAKRGAVREGERILVHAGAGGVGMAAIQIAHASRRGSHRQRRQPEQTRSAQDARRETRDRLAPRRFCRSGDGTDRAAREWMWC